MQDGVLHPADVLVDFKPISDLGGVERHGAVVRIAVAVEVPGRIDEGVHGIGLAPGRAAALGTRHVDELRHVFERRTAGAGDLDAVRQQHRKLAFRNRHDAARRAVNDRNRSAPVALARDAPILDAVSDGRFAEAVPLGVGAHPAARFFAGQAGPLAGVFDNAVFHKGLRHAGFHGERAIRGTDHGADEDAVLPAEFEIAFVVRGHGHDGASAVAHQHEIADPHRDLLAAVRVDGVVAGGEAFLFDVAGVAAGARVHHGLGAGLAFGVEQRRVERMLGGEDHASGAVDGVDAGGEDADGLAGRGQSEIGLGAVRAPDPVALHGEDALGPAAFQLGHVVEKLVGVIRDPEKPLLEGALLDGGLFMPPAAALHHLLIGQHGGALRDTS